MHSKCKAVCIVIYKYGFPESAKKKFPQLHMLEGWDIGQAQDYSFNRIYESWNTNPNPLKGEGQVRFNKSGEAFQNHLLTF